MILITFRCVVVCCCVLRFIAVFILLVCDTGIMQYSFLSCDTDIISCDTEIIQVQPVCCSLLQSVAVCCSLLQSAAVCCSLSQSVDHLDIAGLISEWYVAHMNLGMVWLWSVGSIKLQVSFAEYCLFQRALLQKRAIILSILLTTPQSCVYCSVYLCKIPRINTASDCIRLQHSATHCTQAHMNQCS